ncbi:DUF4258 domain-containing protein [Nostoc sp. C117]|uniref:DUF4258 domain-containing protein n=2 Tax=unclassified Nostoc TaxID=2593658 RepID=UPI00370D8F77
MVDRPRGDNTGVKPIRFSQHALGYVTKRGFTIAEVEESIRSSSWEEAEENRLQCHKDFTFGQEWNGKVYATKRIRPIFMEKATEIVVITVYTYYF